MIAAASFDTGFIGAGNRTSLAYDATVTSKRRANIPALMRSEDRELTPYSRNKLIAAARDLPRNFAIAAWAIRKHLDFVSTFHFHAATGDTGLDNELDSFIKRRSQPNNCDISGRHNLAKMIRMAEARRTVDGDVMLVRQASGAWQAIEADRVKNDQTIDIKDNQQMIDGVIVNRVGRPLKYLIHTRKFGNSFSFDRAVPARHVDHLGYFDRFDQTRGISPLAPAINSLRDVYENFNYALAKAKVAQLFTMAIYRDGDADESVDKATTDLSSGSAILDLEQDDKAEFLESKQPSQEFQSYMQAMIGVSLKSLDLPFTFYDESFTNFFGSRAALILYQKSTEAKKADLRELLNNWTHWQLKLGILRGDFTLPRGMTLGDLKHGWIHSGMPFWNPIVEYKAYKIAVSNGWITNAEVRKETHGDNIEDVYQAIEQEKIMREKYGVITEIDLATQKQGNMK